MATRLNAVVKGQGIVGNNDVHVGLHRDHVRNADEADEWLLGAIDDLDTQMIVNESMRFRAGNVGSVWLDTTLTGTLKNERLHRKHVRVFWNGFSQEGKMLVGLDVTFEPDFLTESVAH